MFWTSWMTSLRALVCGRRCLMATKRNHRDLRFKLDVELLEGRLLPSANHIHVLPLTEHALAPVSTPASHVGAINTSLKNSTKSAHDTSPNWSGYAINAGSGVTAVGGTWVQPSVSGTGNTSSSAWVGMYVSIVAAT